MRVVDLIRPYQDGLARIIDETPPGVDIRRYLLPSDAISYEHRDGGATGPIPDDTLVLVVAGPDADQHADSDAVDALLGRLEVGARAILFLAWEPEEIPYHRFLDALTVRRCQVVQLATIDMSSIRSAAVVERVEEMQAPRGVSGEVVAASPPDDEGRLGLELRLANEHRFSEFAARHLRATIRAAGTGTAVHRESTAYRIRLEREVKERDARIAKLKARVTELETSTSYKVGRTLIRSTRSPGAFLRLPMDMYRLWRTRGR
jgi:hypothetical protein